MFNGKKVSAILLFSFVLVLGVVLSMPQSAAYSHSRPFYSHQVTWNPPYSDGAYNTLGQVCSGVGDGYNLKSTGEDWAWFSAGWPCNGGGYGQDQPGFTAQDSACAGQIWTWADQIDYSISGSDATLTIQVRLVDTSTQSTVYSGNLYVWTSGSQDGWSVINYRTLSNSQCLTNGHTYIVVAELIGQANPCFGCGTTTIQGTGNSRDMVHNHDEAHIRFYQIAFYYN